MKKKEQRNSADRVEGNRSIEKLNKMKAGNIFLPQISDWEENVLSEDNRTLKDRITINNYE